MKTKYEPKWKDEITVPHGFYRGCQAMLLEHQLNADVGYKYWCCIDDKTFAWLTDYEIGRE